MTTRLIREDGQATVMAAVTLPIFCGFLGLALDVGSFYTARQHMQAAADAAAQAAILELKRGHTTSMLDAAIDAIESNGVDAGDVTMNYPPKAGQHIGDGKYVEVIVGETVPTMFVRFVLPKNSFGVSGRAVAGLSGLPPAGVFILNRSRARSLEVSGGSSLTSDLDVWVSSSSSSAVSVGGGSCINARAVGVTGGYEPGCYSSTPIPGMVPDADPLASLTPPSVGACTAVNLTVKKQTTTLDPGVYCGGLDINTNSNVTLRPGVYVMRGGGFNVKQSDVNGAGVVIYITDDAMHEPAGVSIDSNATVRLSAPATGPHAGVVVFYDRALTPQTVPFSVHSSAQTRFEGTIYALNQHLDFLGGTKDNDMPPWTIMVADTVRIHGGSDLRIPADFDRSAVPSPLTSGVIVE
jgi:hypothetical protein